MSWSINSCILTASEKSYDYFSHSAYYSNRTILFMDLPPEVFISGIQFMANGCTDSLKLQMWELYSRRGLKIMSRLFSDLRIITQECFYGENVDIEFEKKTRELFYVPKVANSIDGNGYYLGILALGGNPLMYYGSQRETLDRRCSLLRSTDRFTGI